MSLRWCDGTKCPPARKISESLPVNGRTVRLSYTPIIPYQPICIAIDGVVEWPDKTKIRITKSPLPPEMVSLFTDFTLGRSYDLDFVTGVLTFFEYLTVEHCYIDYYIHGDGCCIAKRGI